MLWNHANNLVSNHTATNFSIQKGAFSETVMNVVFAK